jgi:division protein CdvB (Snf7/Vps24/ESCRT-III family)
MGIKEKIQGTINTLVTVTKQIDVKQSSLAAKDALLFNEIVRAKQLGNAARATMLANELSQIRRTRRSLAGSKIAIESIVQRLETTKDLGELAMTLGPAVQVAASVSKELAITIPEATRSLNESFQDMSSMMSETGHLTGVTPDIQLSNDEAERIIYEAQLAAETDVKEKFPEAPTEIKQGEQEEA